MCTVHLNMSIARECPVTFREGQWSGKCLEYVETSTTDMNDLKAVPTRSRPALTKELNRGDVEVSLRKVIHDAFAQGLKMAVECCKVIYFVMKRFIKSKKKRKFRFKRKMHSRCEKKSLEM